MVTIHSLDGKFLDASDEFLSFIGYSLEYLKEIDNYSLFHPNDRGRIWVNSHSKVMTKSCSTYYRILTKKGKYIWVKAYIHYNKHYNVIIKYTKKVTKIELLFKYITS